MPMAVNSVHSAQARGGLWVAPLVSGASGLQPEPPRHSSQPALLAAADHASTAVTRLVCYFGDGSRQSEPASLASPHGGWATAGGRMSAPSIDCFEPT
jgi:hypothetical protein